MTKTYLPGLSVDQLRTLSQSILNTARSSPVILDRLARRGWGAEKLDAVQSAVDAFDAAARQYVDVKGEGEAASERFTSAEDAFRRGLFREHVGLADAVFRSDVDARAALRLDDGVGRLDRSYDAWQPQARDFYARLLNEASLQPALAEFNVSAEELQQGADEVDRLSALYDRRRELDSERQQLRRDRDALRAALEDEIGQFRNFAALALADMPDRLERLGFTVPSE